MKTYATKTADIKRQQHVIDASGQILGRLATQAACLLMGKHKPIFSRIEDTGDIVVVINAAKVRVTGKKAHQKMYYSHSGFPGGFKEITYEALMAKDPTLVIHHAVNGMLPHTFMSAKMKRRLKVFAGAANPELVPPPKAPKAEAPSASEAK
ncbi:MAG: 50S ribosomal protein L13 [Dehalococcoidales bacterium]|nr:50S ribosomal protein L13 [Dehalococcoidales bacterium]